MSRGQIIFKKYNNEKIDQSFEYNKQDKPLVDFFNNKAKDFISNRVSTIKTISLNNKFIGYYAIAMSSVEASDLYDEKKAATFPHPCIKLGRILINKNLRGKRIGKSVIIHIIQIAQALNKHVSCRFIAVDAKKGVEGFYLKNGFIPIKQNKQKSEDTTTMLFDLKT